MPASMTTANQSELRIAINKTQDWFDEVAKDAPPGYRYELFLGPPSPMNRDQIEMRFKVSLDDLPGQRWDTERVFDLDSLYRRGHATVTVTDLFRKALDVLMDSTLGVMHKEIYEQYGEYPNVRIWALAHNVVNRNMRKNEPVPGYVFPKWNAKVAHKEWEANRNGGLRRKDGSMAGVKKVKGASGKKAPSKPKCPKHERTMDFHTEENLWRCNLPDCGIIFRPKVEHLPGHVLLGKGEITMKIVVSKGGPLGVQRDPQQIVLVSDDNVALDVTSIIREISTEMTAELGMNNMVVTARFHDGLKVQVIEQ
jgi:hypothetical protein